MTRINLAGIIGHMLTSKVGPFLALSLALSGCGGGKPDKPLVPSTPDSRRADVPAASEIEDLISDLSTVGDPSAGAHQTAWVSQFMAIDEEPRFEGGILGSEKPAIHPAMKRLVQIGVGALPALIRHLNDDRETKLVVDHGGGFIGGMWFSDEYDSRHTDPKRRPKNVGTHFEKSVPGQKYGMRVGDLCYVAIGQIVNRGLNALRYQPSSCEVINSPVQTPALAEAVRHDWEGLTADQHRASLEEDAYDLFTYDASDAIKRLLYYYPADGERVALKLLGRNPYDHGEVWDLADKMAASNDPDTWRTILKDCRRRFGDDAAATMPHWIRWSNWETSRDHPQEIQDRAAKILESLFPDYSPYRHACYSVAPVDDQSRLVQALSCFPNPKLDKAVHQAFRNALEFHAKDDSARIDMDEMAVACAERMAGKGFDSEYLDYLERRITEIEQTPQDSIERYRLDKLRACLKTLSPRKE